MREGDRKYMSLHDREVWDKACKWMQEQQIQRDAEICETKEREQSHDRPWICSMCAEAILNQERE